MTAALREAWGRTGAGALALLMAVSFLTACDTTSATKASSASGGQTAPMTAAPADRGRGPAGAPAPIGPVSTSQEYLDVNIGSEIRFDYDAYDLRPDARATVERWAEWLQQNPSVTVTVEGHCDERGTREYNLGLGERRATAARNYLIALGIGGNRVGTLSYGKERPVCVSSTDDCWGRNRRDSLRVN
jgi:peptidoglycan-associated lipoprotein